MALFNNMTLFGFTFGKPPIKPEQSSFEIDRSDAAAEILENQIGGAYGYMFESVTVPTTEIESIRTYRNIAANPDVDQVLSEIRNEIFIFDVPGKKAIDINLDATDISKTIKDKIHEEYSNIYRILDFHRRGIDYFDRWYVDGRIYFHKIVNNKKLTDGIQSVIMIDPLKIKKIREVPQRDVNGVYDVSKINEYYIYTDMADGKTSTGSNIGLKVLPESITYCDSGIVLDGVVTGHLHKAVVPFNNLKLMEESLLIYRVSRAPERRVIYVDVGNLPKNKAEQYIRDLMNRFRNKLIYDNKTGGLADKRNVLSMMEDYWLPRRSDGKGTEITTLPGGDNLGITADVEYFSKKLMDSLNVPASRFQDQAPSFPFGRGVEIGRDEYRFKKFLDRLRNRFIMIFEDMLKTQLILKKILVESDWEKIRDDIIWVFAEDNSFVEYKEMEVLNNRINTLSSIDNYVGKYFTRKWVMQNVMHLTDKEIDDIDNDIIEDKKRMIKLAAELKLLPGNNNNADDTTSFDQPEEEE